MKASLAILGVAALSLAGAARAHANPCGNEGTPPTVFATEVTGPQTLDQNGVAPAGWDPSNGRLSRAGVTYVSGSNLQVSITTDLCTVIAGVRFGTRVVGTTDSGGFWYSAPPRLQSDPTRHTHLVILHFPYAYDGPTDTVTIVVGRSGGTGTQETAFPLVRVRSVEESNVLAPASFSRANLYNMFAQGLSNKFGLANSTITTLADGSRWRIYDYDPNDISVTVTPQGVGFQFIFKLDLPACDPKVRAYGKFRLTADTGGFGVEWTDPARASVTWPTGCSVIEELPIVSLVAELVNQLVEDRLSGSVRSEVEAQILGSLPDDGGLFLAGSASTTDELWVNLRLPVPSITIDLPYDAFDMPRNATPFPAGEKIVLTASRLGMNDAPADISPPVVIRSTANGVPRAGTAFYPRPMSVTRTAALPRPPLAVGRLLARTVTSPSFLPRLWNYAPGCAVVAPLSTASTFTSVRFGVNDSAEDAQRMRAAGGAPGYRLRAHFLAFYPLFVRDYPVCTSYVIGSP